MRLSSIIPFTDLSSSRSRLTSSTTYLLAHSLVPVRFIRTTTPTGPYHLATSLRSSHRNIFPLQRIHSPPSLSSRSSRLLLSTMSSATTFYDFEPVDSTLFTLLYFLQPHPLASYPTNHPSPLNRKGLPLPPHRPQRQSRPRRQHRFQVRLHASVPRPREALPGHQV